MFNKLMHLFAGAMGFYFVFVAACHVIYPGYPVSAYFLGCVAGVGSFVMYMSIKALLYRSRKSKEDGEGIVFGFTMKTLEDARESTDHFQKMIKRAVQIKKCKKNTDAAAFEQAAREEHEVEAMRSNK